MQQEITQTSGTDQFPALPGDSTTTTGTSKLKNRQKGMERLSLNSMPDDPNPSIPELVVGTPAGSIAIPQGLKAPSPLKNWADLTGGVWRDTPKVANAAASGGAAFPIEQCPSPQSQDAKQSEGAAGKAKDDHKVAAAAAKPAQEGGAAILSPSVLSPSLSEAVASPCVSDAFASPSPVSDAFPRPPLAPTAPGGMSPPPPSEAGGHSGEKRKMSLAEAFGGPSPKEDKLKNWEKLSDYGEYSQEGVSCSSLQLDFATTQVQQKSPRQNEAVISPTPQGAATPVGLPPQGYGGSTDSFNNNSRTPRNNEFSSMDFNNNSTSIGGGVAQASNVPYSEYPNTHSQPKQQQQQQQQQHLPSSHLSSPYSGLTPGRAGSDEQGMSPPPEYYTGGGALPAPHPPVLHVPMNGHKRMNSSNSPAVSHLQSPSHQMQIGGRPEPDPHYLMSLPSGHSRTASSDRLNHGTPNNYGGELGSGPGGVPQGSYVRSGQMSPRADTIQMPPGHSRSNSGFKTSPRGPIGQYQMPSPPPHQNQLAGPPGGSGYVGGYSDQSMPLPNQMSPNQAVVNVPYDAFNRRGSELTYEAEAALAGGTPCSAGPASSVGSPAGHVRTMSTSLLGVPPTGPPSHNRSGSTSQVGSPNMHRRQFSGGAGRAHSGQLQESRSPRADSPLGSGLPSPTNQRSNAGSPGHSRTWSQDPTGGPPIKSDAVRFVRGGFMYPGKLNRKERRRIQFTTEIDPTRYPGAVYVGDDVPDGPCPDVLPEKPLPADWKRPEPIPVDANNTSANMA